MIHLFLQLWVESIKDRVGVKRQTAWISDRTLFAEEKQGKNPAQDNFSRVTLGVSTLSKPKNESLLRRGFT
ncbi:hypothetical protein OXYTRIMIC_603 [Oxytricha trifallax]|uniref:Uncharacterized protein n=1 Tax=Oxytricha trifallax TaxID=1172189 RepID=A0A073HYZ6_9SPIT|nr:hypothetical protein OXYTRIMIC_603 [Oxytricha trifallax]